ncbi:transcriptional regulator domain-containing protein [Mesorhizobium sp. NPDC059054]|uniref:transcriptional regulator domain-containing protein n=1 Tax=Mesorhizobium sp. NPDC059054 TaxID=3346711 RepID=UPI0036C1A8E0
MHLTSRGWAWEFLRRNPVFRKDLAVTLRGVVSSRSRSADIISLPANTVDLSRWGVLFCKFDRK